MNFSIQELISKKLAERETRTPTSWHPSKLGQCLTGVYLERLGIPPDSDFSERLLRVFSVGKVFEEWITSLITAEASNDQLDVVLQGRVESKEYDLTGNYDLKIKTKEGQEIIYEFKTKHSRGFWHMNRQGGPNRHHQYQLWVYLWLANVETGRLTYISKDDLSLVEYIVKRDDEVLKKEVMNELDILNRAWKLKLPPHPPAPDVWQSKFCRWHKSCVAQKDYLPEGSSENLRT